MWTTSVPRSRTPDAKAAASGSELGRMSCPTTIDRGWPTTCANAAPTARATSSSSWSGTRPRMSYALTMAAISVTRRLYRTAPTVRLPLRIAHHTQMAAPSHLAWRRRARRTLRRLGRFTDRVGQRLQVVGRRLQRGGIRDQPDDLPAPRRDEAICVLAAQVVAVRFGIGGERADHRGGVCVDIRERGDRSVLARSAGTATGGAHPMNVSRYGRPRRERHARDASGVPAHARCGP